MVAEFSAVEAKLKIDESNLQALKKRRELEAPLMSKSALDELVRTIEAAERALRRGRDDLKHRLSQRTNEVVRDLDRELGEVIAEVAKARGAETVISSTATVYTNPRLDITDAVLQKLRAGAPK